MWLFQPYCWMRSLTRPSWWVSLHSKTMWWTIQARLEKEWRTRLGTSVHWYRGCQVRAERLRLLEIKSFFGEYWVLWIRKGKEICTLHLSLIGKGFMEMSPDVGTNCTGLKLPRTEKEVGWVVRSHTSIHTRSHTSIHTGVTPDIASVERELASCHLHLPKDNWSDEVSWCMYLWIEGREAYLAIQRELHYLCCSRNDLQMLDREWPLEEHTILHTLARVR